MPNKLINETSPYLLQHAHNPVDWYPYGNEALEEAKRRNVPLIVSIGYSACHWCHVMEHESFSVQEVAEIMNKHFLCIKVDREERPDIDQIFLNAVQLLHGQGGWPLNCFALPDGRPFWGGTYFRPEQWKDVLLQLSGMFHNNHDEILQQAERIHQGIKSMALIEKPSEKNLSKNLIQEAYDQLAQRFDTTQGGTKGSPKFPMPVLWQFILNYQYLSQSPEALSQLRLTLDKMASGGIFDQLAGGFSRYSTDSEWKVPHFEKMLYDNAQLTTLYTNAFLTTGYQGYSAVVDKILQFIKNNLTSHEGAFYSALDADSDGSEGKFYVWTKDEILNLLPEYGELLCRYWGVGKQGYWEKGQNILLRPYTDDYFAMSEHLSSEELKQLVIMATRVLLNYRNQRERPGLDDKIICSWNALMIKAYAVAASAYQNEEWAKSALSAADFLIKNMISKNGKILRSWKNGQAKINGFLDDYAFTADAFISLYQLTFDEAWLFKARQLAEMIIQYFSQESSPLFWYLPVDNEDLSISSLSRVLETSDGVEASGNAVMASLLLSLGNYFEDESYIQRSVDMCSYMQKNVVAYPAYHGQWASIIAAHAHGTSVIVIAGENATLYANQLKLRYNPFSYIAAASNKSDLPVFKNKFKEGRTVIYKCVNHSCDAPVEKVEDLAL